MKRSIQLTALALFGVILAACSDSNNFGNNLDPAPPQSVDFTQFVTEQVNNTADDREAVNINDLDFSFNDQDNEQAFDGLF